MAFEGWPKAMLAFYSELEVNNTKEFWEANREVYDRDVRAPMEALLAELAGEFGTAKVFRPYRDVRFSNDKSPYKLEVAAVIATHEGAGRYVRANADGIAAGGGYYRMAADQLQRLREAIDDEALGAELAGLLAGLEADGFAVRSDELKTAPRGWSKDHPRIDLLRRKTLTFLREAEPGPQVHTRAALDVVAEAWRAGTPLLAWLDRHVGPSDSPPRRRGR